MAKLKVHLTQTRALGSFKEVGTVDMKAKKQARAVVKETSRSLSGVVGADTYEVWDG